MTIQRQKNLPNIPYMHQIAVIPGDLNGKTVTDAVLTVNDALVEAKKFKNPIIHEIFLYDADYFLREGITELREQELNELKRNDHIFLGAIGDPTKIKPGVIEIGLLLKIRQAFDQYVNLRPVVLPEGVPSVIVGKYHKDINFEICRENSEGLYVAKGRIENPGTNDEIGIQEMWCSYKGVKRLAEYAAERAIIKGNEKGKKPTLHFVFKNNVLTYASPPWDRVFQEYQKREDINVRYMHIDNFIMQMVTNPAQFDVVITENMFGDIATDLGAVIQGGIGTAVSGNIDPTGRFPSMFEPIHGTAPDKWYEKDAKGEYIPGTFRPDLVQQIKPEAAFMSYAMMLEQIGEVIAADTMKQAALANLRNPNYKTNSLDKLVEQACDFVRAK